MMAMAMGFFCTESRDPVLHRVGGGKFTWRPNVNFTEWARHDHFYKGDWLCKISSSFSFTKYHMINLSPQSSHFIA